MTYKAKMTPKSKSVVGAPDLSSRLGNVDGELAVIERLIASFPSPPHGEVWAGDDSAVLPIGSTTLLFAADCLVEGVHFDRRYSTMEDVGFKAMAVNVSDIAAMGGSPWRAVVTISGATGSEIEALMAGVTEAGRRWACQIVGGDLSGGAQIVISLSIIGLLQSGEPVLRSGARESDSIFVTGPLGSAGAGLRLLGIDPLASAPSVDCYRRPTARLAQGLAARVAGATAMIDLSDGLGIDLDRLARASGIGVDLDSVVVADGATIGEALGAGEDYELLFTAPDQSRVERVFQECQLKCPIRIGRCVADPTLRMLDGRPLLAIGYEHQI